jgi:hypothetical protein
VARPALLVRIARPAWGTKPQIQRWRTLAAITELFAASATTFAHTIATAPARR